MYNWHKCNSLATASCCTLSDYQNSTANSNFSSCDCPEECNVFSYSPELSVSGLSIRSVQPYIVNADLDVANHNLVAQEIASRVDETGFSQTIQQLQDLIESHSQIRSGQVFIIEIESIIRCP